MNMPLLRASRVGEEPHPIPSHFHLLSLPCSPVFLSIPSQGAVQSSLYSCPPWLVGSDVGLSVVRLPPGMEEKRLASNSHCLPAKESLQEGQDPHVTVRAVSLLVQDPAHSQKPTRLLNVG